MRVAIDASTWFNRRGFGRFTRELVGALVRQRPPHELVLLTDGSADCGVGLETVAVPQSRPVTQAAVAESARSPRDLLRFTRAARSLRPDVLFYPAVYSWFPCPPGVPNLLTLHDAIAEHFPALVFPQWRYRALWRLKVALAQRQATRFLTVSAAARREIVAYMGIDASRIDLTTEGPKAVFRPQDRAAARMRVHEALAGRLPADARYLCYVGGFAPHKNLLTLVQAFERARASGHHDLHLLLVGDADSAGFSSNVAQLRARLAASPRLRDHVHFTGYVDDDLLAAIYAASLALVLPSFSEGFGLPIIEAMACGTPVLAAAAGSMPEIVGDAGRLFDPNDSTAITASISALAGDDRVVADLRARSLARSALFSWDKAATMTLEAIERCARPRRG